ncbi:unnamed protein product, partial [Staurois parvus]
AQHSHPEQCDYSEAHPIVKLSLHTVNPLITPLALCFGYLVTRGGLTTHGAPSNRGSWGPCVLAQTQKSL